MHNTASHFSRARARSLLVHSKRGTVAAVACAAAVVAIAVSAALLGDETADHVRRATVRVIVPPAPEAGGVAVQGTGVIISEDGYALTAAHVVRTAAARTVEVILNSGTRRATGVTAEVTEFVGVLGRPSPQEMGGDYALLKLTGRRRYPHLEVADAERIAAGSRCYLAGFPMSDGLRATPPGPLPHLKEGRITAVMRSEDGLPAALNTDVPVREGMSGGPCTDANGRLLGLAVMYSSQANANLVLPACSFRQVWEHLLAGKR